MAALAYGIDVSVAQYVSGNPFPMQQAYNEGVRFAIIKAGGSDGGIYMDSQFRTNYNNAKAAGINVGLYWYTAAASVAALRTEITYLLNNIQGLQFELPLFLDLEETSLYNYALDLALEWNSNLISNNYYPGIYSMYSWFYGNLNDTRLTNYSIWLAYWVNTEPTFQWHYDFWQQDAQTIAGVYTDYDWQYTDYTWIKSSQYNGWGGTPSPSYTIRTSSPAGSGSPFYNTVASGGYNTSIVGNGAIAGANVLNNCVGYSQGRMMEMYDQAVSPITSAAANIFSMFNANAEDWYNIAVANGFNVGQTPTYGAVGVWYSAAQNVGHVANVEDYQNGIWEISESHYNYPGGAGSWDYSYLQNNADYLPAFIGADSTWALIGFIYPFNAVPPTPPVPGRQTKLKPWMMLRRIPF